MKIEKGIPMPKPRSEYLKLLNQMAPGDSVLATEGERKCLLRAAKQHNIKVLSAKENGQGIRVWRK